MELKKIRFGVLGVSRVALKGMLPAMRDSEFVELKMIGSRSPEKAKEIAERFGAECWGTYEDVLKNKEIDAIYVSLPNALHEEWTIKALEAGHHVLCEKPAAISYVSAKRMVEAARKNNRRLLEGFMFRYHPQHKKVEELIRSGAVGGLLGFEGTFGYAMPEKGSNAMSLSLGGGSFNDQLPYPVYSSRMIFNEEPESILCNTETDTQSGVSVKVDATLTYPGGKTAFVSSVFGSYYQSTYSVLGTKAHLRMGRAYAVPRDMEVKIFLDQNDRVEEIIIPPADHFRLMLDDFAGEISRGNAGAAEYEKDLLAQARVLEAARVSYSEKRVVYLSEFDGEFNSAAVDVRPISKNTFAKILLTGGSGTLGGAVLRSGLVEGVVAPSHEEMDITDEESVERFFKEHNPDAVIHCAAMARMSKAEKDPEQAMTVNIFGTSNLVRATLRAEARNGKHIRFIYISTDGVYEGTRGNYSEHDEAAPYNIYCWTKLGGECVVRILSNACIVRTSFFDPANIPFDTAATDMYSSRMPVDDLARALSLIFYSDFKGVINIGDEKKSLYDWYREAKPSIQPCTFDDIVRSISFPLARDSSLNTTLWKSVSGQLQGLQQK